MDEAVQVLIGERPSGECQRYLLSQRGQRCEARLSRGPQRCEVIMGKRQRRRRHLDGETAREREREKGRNTVNVAIKPAARLMGERDETTDLDVPNESRYDRNQSGGHCVRCVYVCVCVYSQVNPALVFFFFFQHYSNTLVSH